MLNKKQQRKLHRNPRIGMSLGTAQAATREAAGETMGATTGKMKWRGLDNVGAALVTAIVIVAFISVLGTTLLYMTSQNFLIKQTDYQNTQGFYETEEALDTLKADIALLAEEAYTEAYKEYSEHFALYTDAAMREELFAETYFTYLKDKIETSENDGFNYNGKVAGDPSTAMTAVLQELMGQYGTGSANVGESNFADLIFVETAATPYASDVAGREFVFYDVKAAKDVDGYYTKLGTDIVVVMPELDFGNEGQTFAEDETGAIDFNDCVLYRNWARE